MEEKQEHRTNTRESKERREWSENRETRDGVRAEASGVNPNTLTTEPRFQAAAERHAVPVHETGAAISAGGLDVFAEAAAAPPRNTHRSLVHAPPPPAL